MIKIVHFRTDRGRHLVAVSIDFIDETIDYCSPGNVYPNRYHVGLEKPHFPLPAIPLEVHWPHNGYLGMVYINDATNSEDPVMVACWDFWGLSEPVLDFDYYTGYYHKGAA